MAAAAALLRSLATRTARAPPHPRQRQLVARGLHGSARPGPEPDGSLPPPTRNEIHDGKRHRFLAGMAGAGFPSLASKLARAPPHHGRLHDRVLHSSTSANQSSMPFAAKFAFFSLIATTGFMHFCVVRADCRECKDWIKNGISPAQSCGVPKDTC